MDQILIVCQIFQIGGGLKFCSCHCACTRGNFNINQRWQTRRESGVKLVRYYWFSSHTCVVHSYVGTPLCRPVRTTRREGCDFLSSTRMSYKGRKSANGHCYNQSHTKAVNNKSHFVSSFAFRLLLL